MYHAEERVQVKPMTMELTQKSPALVAPKENRATWQPGLILLSILALALLVRIIFLPQIGYQGDTEHFAMWVAQINRFGLFHFYQTFLHPWAWDRTYPQLAILIFAAFGTQFGPRFYEFSPTFVVWLKVVPMLCELGMITVVYWW